MTRFLTGILLMTALAAPARSADFVKVRGTRFEIQGRPYYFLGTNLWAGMNLGSRGPGGDRGRLRRELDRLHALGVDNLRVIAASEGPDTAPWRIVPALQKAPGVYDPELLDGLDYLLFEMGKRGMKAVVVLNDFWHWSGGMAQYVAWSQNSAIPYPPPAANGDWDTYQRYSARFYKDKKAVAWFRKLVRTIVQRKNVYTKVRYRDDPAIMAWQLANEPRGTGDAAALEGWIRGTAALIKSLDRNHLVTTGCEGETPWPQGSGLDFVKDHSIPGIDYATMHIWVQNWGWYDPAKEPETYGAAVAKMAAYFDEHEAKARQLGKPLVLEEFGLTRDAGDFDPSAGTLARDRYFDTVFKKVFSAAQAGSPVAGVNFWAWAGEGRPAQPGGIWKAGDPFIGDPPHEQQGWYSVYDGDSATVKLIGEWAGKMRALPAEPGR
jgi:mannan endo-1,4-beta-mannosidase